MCTFEQSGKQPGKFERSHHKPVRAVPQIPTIVDDHQRELQIDVRIRRVPGKKAVLEVSMAFLSPRAKKIVSDSAFCEDTQKPAVFWRNFKTWCEKQDIGPEFESRIQLFLLNRKLSLQAV